MERNPLPACADRVTTFRDIDDGWDAKDEAARVAQPDDAGSALTDLPEMIGPYRIRGILGRGGMGTVYEAEQERPRRIVALKVLKSGLGSRAAIRRFEAEAQLLARLTHPGIAQVFHAGTHQPRSANGARAAARDPGPVPFFAMELIAHAAPITDYARAHGLDLRARLALFAEVCDAVDHGHGRGVIHRDLKPENIVVDQAGRPKVIDFGVARAADRSGDEASANSGDVADARDAGDLRDPGDARDPDLTQAGQLIGTLQYMSPEQCDGDPAALDARSDVYSLGVVLYELLCGSPPYDVHETPVHEATRRVREEAPRRPGLVVSGLRGDVESIVLKALEKDRDRRYASAAELARDVRRHLGDQPIGARPPRFAERATRFVRRNRALCAAMFALLVVLAGSIACIVALLGEVEAARASSVPPSIAAPRAPVLPGIAIVGSHRLAVTAVRVVDLDLDALTR